MNITPRIYTGSLLFAGTVLVNSLIGSPLVQAAENSDERDSRLSFELGAGAEYDSNISVTEIDSTTGEDDIAAVFDADVSYDSNIGTDTELSLSYSFSQSLHNDYSEFDIQSHLITTDLSHDFGSFDAGIGYRYADSRLDGNGFLNLHQISPYYSRFLNAKYFLRADYTYTDKSFDNRGSRDSTVNAVGADIYYFVDGVQSYFVAGYKYGDEDSKAQQYTFKSHNYRLRYLRRITLASKEARLSLGYDYEDRNYDSITPSIGEKRNDERHSIEVDLELSLTERLAVLVEYEHGNNSSDLPIVDYRQNLLGVKLILQF